MYFSWGLDKIVEYEHPEHTSVHRHSKIETVYRATIYENLKASKRYFLQLKIQERKHKRVVGGVKTWSSQKPHPLVGDPQTEGYSKFQSFSPRWGVSPNIRFTTLGVIYQKESPEHLACIQGSWGTLQNWDSNLKRHVKTFTWGSTETAVWKELILKSTSEGEVATETHPGAGDVSNRHFGEEFLHQGHWPWQASFRSPLSSLLVWENYPPISEPASASATPGPVVSHLGTWPHKSVGWQSPQKSEPSGQSVQCPVLPTSASIIVGHIKTEGPMQPT